MLNKRVLAKTLAVLLLPLALPLGGCKPPTLNLQFQCGGGKPCTYGASANIPLLVTAPELAPADLTTAMNAGYQVILTVPSDVLTLDSTSVAQATLTATTDTGYSSSIVVNLTPAGSAPSTLV